MRRIKLGLFLLCLSSLCVFTPIYAASDCPAFPYFRPTNGPLALVNCDFHIHYEKRITEIINTFGAVDGRPVILNLGGRLVFKYNGKTETVDINPDAYHDLKTFAHAVFSVYLALSTETAGSLSSKTRHALQEIKDHLSTAIVTIPSLPLTRDEQLLSQNLANLTETFINKILTKNDFTQHEREHYFEKARPLIMQVAKKATAMELSTLEKAIDHWLAAMSREDKKKIGIVVATSHQARAQEISLQYFAKKFGFRYGEGALHEKGFVVLEGKFDEASALQLLARHYLDRDAAKSILNNPERLQRDLLAEAAKNFLE